jgi:hypothetical protein
MPLFYTLAVRDNWAIGTGLLTIHADFTQSKSRPKIVFKKEQRIRKGRRVSVCGL